METLIIMAKKQTQKPRSVGMTDADVADIKEVLGDNESFASFVNRAAKDLIRARKNMSVEERGHLYASKKADGVKFEEVIRCFVRDSGVPFQERVAAGPYFIDFVVNSRTPLVLVLKSDPESIPLGIAELLAIKSIFNRPKALHALVVPYFFKLTDDIQKIQRQGRLLILTPADLGAYIQK